MDLTNQTPEQIDNQLKAVLVLKAEQQMIAARLTRTMKEAEKRGNARLVAEKEEQLEKVAERIEELEVEAYPFHAEYEARNGWTRFYLVTNVDGHVHSTMDCGTLRRTTSAEWLTEYSGTAHSWLVQLAGERACSVCFKGLEGLITAQRSQLSWDVEQRAAAEQAKQAKAAEKGAKDAAAAARLAKQGGSLNAPVDLTYREVAKTVQQAKTAAVNCMVDYGFRRYGKNFQMKRENLVLLRTLRAALIESGQDWETVKVELEKKAGAKYRKQLRESQAFARQMGMPLED